MSSGSALNDAQWHSVDLSSRRGRLSIAVDGEGATAHPGLFPISTGEKLFFGGKKTNVFMHNHTYLYILYKDMSPGSLSSAFNANLTVFKRP